MWEWKLTQVDIRTFEDQEIQDEKAYRDKTQLEDLALLALLDKEIATEQALLTKNQERLQEQTTISADLRTTGPQEVNELIAETAAITKERQGIRKQLEKVTITYKLFGPTLVSHLKTDYRRHPGKVLCPEGKVCASVRTSEENCNYWECPSLPAMMSNSTNMDTVNGNTTSVTASQLTTTTTQLQSLSLSTTSNFTSSKNNVVTLIQNET